jgi:hypothetical protein
MPEEIIKGPVEHSARLHPILVGCMCKADTRPFDLCLTLTHLKVVLVEFVILSNNNQHIPSI